MTNSNKLKVYIGLFFILVLISCKNEREPSDCEANFRTNLVLGCANEEDLNFCLIDIWSYFKCKERNSKKMYNKI
jgi:hypothetical protein